jgi:putative DNA primase/helicase
MRNLPIAYGNSCYAKKWPNKTTTFDELCERLKNTTYTTETVEEYPKLSKVDRDRAKDRGGFVGGQLKDNRRKRENVVCRSMLTHDADHADKDFIEKFTSGCKYAAALYTTHGHTPENPRVRIIVPFTRDVTPDEFTAIGRYFAEEWGIDQFDECSYRPQQLMYWPTTPANGEYVFKRVDGEWLDPDKYLSAHPNWKDCSLLPTSSRESEVRSSATKKQADPLEKDGIVGVFCRTYTVQDAIDKFLPDIYAPSAMEGRYDYIPADSSAGVVIYDDKFAYSHHATDPACGMLLNAFDIVRIHKFGDLDDKKSFTAMSEFAVQDDEVKKQLALERKEAAEREFGATDWENCLELDKNGKIKDTLDNIVLILRMDSELQNIAFNKHRDGIDANGGLPWEQMKPGWNDSDNASLKVYLSKKYGLYSPAKTKDATVSVAAERAYHPIMEYLEALPDWDGVQRVDTLLIDYFGAADSKYTRAVMRKTLAAAVARIYEPGKKFDSVLILNGPQGVGKSTFFSKLAGDWFSDSLTLTDMKDKSGAEKLQGYWILELSELNGMKKADVETVKSFITRQDDKYRASYGVNVESHLRQSIIVGSTNAESGFLRDITGNRRFWPVRIGGDAEKKPWELDEETVKQIWAEALTIYRRGEILYLRGDEALEAASEQAAAMESDDREGIVRNYLDTLLPEEWDSMSLYERRNFLTGSEFGGDTHKGTVRRETVSNIEIWCECFGKDASAIKPADSYAIAAIVKKIDGWDKAADNGRASLPIYGRQRIYRRTEN